MQQYLNAYRQELLDVNNFKPDTVSNYLSCLSQYFEFVELKLGINPLDSTSKHVRQWMSHLKKQNLGRSRLIHHQAAIKRFFAVLIKLKVLAHNPAEALFYMKKQKSDRNQPLAEETAIHLLRALKRNTWLDERDFIILSMLWALGLRISELTALTVGSFEPDHEPSNRIGLLRVPGKGNKERVLFVVEKLYDNLQAYLAHPESPKQESEPMFPTTLKNKAISPNRVQKVIQQLRKITQTKERITPHVLRHTFATHMYQHNVPVEAIEVMLGHGSTDETSIYIHVPEQKKQKALANITITGSKKCQ